MTSAFDKKKTLKIVGEVSFGIRDLGTAGSEGSPGSPRLNIFYDSNEKGVLSKGVDHSKQYDMEGLC